MRKTILQGDIHVLGATGFIGGRIAERLAADFGSERIRRYGSSDCDLRDPDQVQATFGQMTFDDAFIFCPAISRVVDRSPEAAESNLAMLKNLLTALRQRTCMFLLLSSVDVYGKPTELPINEQTPPQPTTPYGESKWLSEQYLGAELQSPASCVLRLPGVYGRGDNGRSVIGRLTRQIAAEETVRLTNGGAAKRDYVDVADVTEVVAALVAQPFSYTFNLATGESRSMSDIVAHIGGVAGKSPRVESIASDPERDFDLTFDANQIRGAFVDVKWTPLEKGVADYIVGERLGGATA